MLQRTVAFENTVIGQICGHLGEILNASVSPAHCAEVELRHTVFKGENDSVKAAGGKAGFQNLSTLGKNIGGNKNLKKSFPRAGLPYGVVGFAVSLRAKVICAKLNFAVFVLFCAYDGVAPIGVSADIKHSVVIKRHHFFRWCLKLVDFC